MKRINMILMAFAMVLTMTQCKKNEAADQNETVTITLDVKHNNGAKVDVNPTIGTVDFETGDKVYVGSGGKYVGFLTHNGTNFVGNITNPTEGQPLQFYFLGNVTPNETLSAGTTEECSVIISDQTEHLPVISCAPSFENYVSGVTAYTGHLLNKCALVKFNVTTPSNSPICITGMKNKVTVDFSQNTVTPSMDGEGVIKLPAGSGENVEKWAILLPQDALEEGEEGTAYLEDATYIGIRPAIPTIVENGYWGEGIIMTISICSVPVGAINGLFTINEDGNQVYFSKGNLQYQPYNNIWRFAENQLDCVGGDNSNISPNYGGWIDLFGWGTGDNPLKTSTDYHAYMSFTDWGINSISNGGNLPNLWRTPTKEEWSYLVFTRTTASGINFAKATVNGVVGMMILPDDWNSSYYDLNAINSTSDSYSVNLITLENWTSIFEAHGVVFLPAAGRRHGTSVDIIPGTQGQYWSSTSNGSTAWGPYFDENYFFLGTGHNFHGYPVRLVLDAE